MPANEFVNDVKIFFDSIRNIGICAALTLGLPFIEKTMPIIYDTNILKFIVITFSISIILSLYVFNLIWLFKNLQSKVQSKIFHMVSSLIIMLLITLAIGSTAFFEVSGKLYQYV